VTYFLAEQLHKVVQVQEKDRETHEVLMIWDFKDKEQAKDWARSMGVDLVWILVR
jgi:hypothetical protein